MPLSYYVSLCIIQLFNPSIMSAQKSNGYIESDANIEEVNENVYIMYWTVW